MRMLTNYFGELTSEAGAAWNRFWYQPSDPIVCSAMRIAVGSLTLAYLLAASFDLVRWFGPAGMLPVQTAQQLSSSASTFLQTSYFSHIQHPGLLWAAHILGCLVVVCWTIGFRSRLTNVLTLVVLLAYVHRAPQLLGPWEMVLSMLVFYLCLAPTGRYWSLDSRSTSARRPLPAEEKSWQANLSIRLIQVHLCGFYLTMAATMLASETWWTGSGLWWLMTRSQARVVDLTFLSQSEYLLNALSHGVVGLTIAFPVFVWNRLTCPLTLGLAGCLWLGLGMVTGQLGLAAGMLVASMAFMTPQQMRCFLARGNKKAAAS
jgi:hypothetical protein